MCSFSHPLGHNKDPPPLASLYHSLRTPMLLNAYALLCTCLHFVAQLHAHYRCPNTTSFALQCTVEMVPSLGAHLCILAYLTGSYKAQLSTHTRGTLSHADHTLRCACTNPAELWFPICIPGSLGHLQPSAIALYSLALLSTATCTSSALDLSSARLCVHCRPLQRSRVSSIALFLSLHSLRLHVALHSCLYLFAFHSTATCMQCMLLDTIMCIVVHSAAL